MTVELVKTSWSQIGKYCRIPFLRLLSPYLTLHSIVLSLNTFLVKSLRVLYMSLVVYRNIAHTWPLTGKTKSTLGIHSSAAWPQDVSVSMITGSYYLFQCFRISSTVISKLRLYLVAFCLIYTES